ncbi:MAG: sulfatase [Chlorobi bacterium]|nr:sulfatase [Chlorobiota bacterium]
MKKIKLLSIVLSALIFSFNSCSAKGEKTTKDKEKKGTPNIILIMADDLGYSDLSCYGSENIKTPVLDKLAEQGIRFNDYHSNGPVCSPTRAALMTGKYQQRVGIEGVITAAGGRDKGLALSEVTVAEALKNEGYVTAMFGKWHLGYDKKYGPVKQGFDEFRGFVSGNIDYFSHIDQEGYFDWWNGEILKDDNGYSTDLITKYGMEFIRKNKDKRFFLYLPYAAPHYPYQARYSKPFRKEGVKQPTDKSIPADSIPAIYRDMVEALDEDVDKLMKTLKELGLDENTLVFFCSDNGGTKKGGKHNLPLRGHKGTLYEGGHRVPAFAVWPGKIKPGTGYEGPVMSMDIYPTLLDIVGGEKPQGIDGISIKNVLLKNETLPERTLFWKFRNARVVRQGDWKLIVTKEKNKEEKIELFNLKDDISESVNLAEKEGDRIENMRKLLDEWLKDVRR